MTYAEKEIGSYRNQIYLWVSIHPNIENYFKILYYINVLYKNLSIKFIFYDKIEKEIEKMNNILKIYYNNS